MRSALRILVFAASFVSVLQAWEPSQHTWSAPWSWTGPREDAKFGLSIASGGDVNGDGIDDMVFAAPYDSIAGAVYGTIFVVFGSTSGWQPELPIASAASASFRGEAAGDHPGGDDEGGSDGLAIVPSVNGDAYDDIVVVSPKSALSGSVDYGAVYLIFGKDTSEWGFDVPLWMADAAFYGEFVMGSPSVAPAGDVNNDGKGDFLVGMSGRPGVSSGKTYLFLGRTSWPGGGGEAVPLSGVANASFVGEQSTSKAGSSVSGVPDLNNDGRDEILIGAPNHSPDVGTLFAGKAYLVLGRATGWSLDENLANAEWAAQGEVANAKVGTCVSDAGDVDDDGKGDFLISTANPTESGRLHLFLGGSIGPFPETVPVSSADTDIFGADFSTGDALTGLGDVNNDGYDDFAVGAPFFDNGVGKAYAVFGRASWPATLAIEQSDGGWRGVAGKFWAGCSVSGGDVNDDGLDDLVIAAAADPHAGYDAGSVFVLPSNYGADQTPPARTVDLGATYDGSQFATLTWTPVSLDANGQPEDMLFYRVLRFRYEFLDPPELSIGYLPAVLHPSVATTDTVDVIGDPGLFYSYRLLAIDTSGNVSTLSTGTGVFDVLTDIPGAAR